MKALVLTISAGQGHNKTARAIGDYLKSQGVDVDIVDTYKYFNTALSNLVEKGYLLSTKFTPAVYGNIYTKAEQRDHSDRINVVDMAGKIISRQFYKFIAGKNPDVIIATHIFAANLVSKFKEKKESDAITFGVLTDFTVHPFWETADLDYYVTPTALLNNQMIKKGIPEERILPFGIPIEMKFSASTDKKEARKLLGFEDKKTAFVMTGSMGYGDVIKYVKELDELEYDFQIVTVCGSNSHLKNQIDRLQTHKKIYNFGFVDNVDLIMDAADIIVSKPGGLTTSESLAKKLPMILIDPIPGQEDRNYEFLINNGLAIGVSETFSVGEALYQLLSSKNRAKCMSKMAGEIGKPDSSKRLGDFIINLIDKE
ncbi:MAG: galactosyldiacylglycerol synthase [Clostridia bacterium]|nr:galactosyldiacylglycerol synthase [Clostridia bacterium]